MPSPGDTPAAPGSLTEPPRPPLSGPPKLQVPNMCMACGQLLKGDELKCPSCGAPLGARRAGARSGKLMVAAGFFLSLFLVAATFSAIAITSPRSSVVAVEPVGDFRGDLLGAVHYENGTAASNVTVWLEAFPDNGTRTDASGAYLLPRTLDGPHRLHFAAANHTTVVVRAYLEPFAGREHVNATLAPGNGTVEVDDDSFAAQVKFTQVIGGLAALMAALLFGGAVACFQRRIYGLALAAAWMSLAMLLLPLPAVVVFVSLVLIVLVMRSKREFR